jgi:hypothetical protein
MVCQECQTFYEIVFDNHVDKAHYLAHTTKEKREKKSVQQGLSFFFSSYYDFQSSSPQKPLNVTHLFSRAFPSLQTSKQAIMRASRQGRENREWADEKKKKMAE